MPMFAKAEISVDARNAATASLSSDCHVTRCNGSRGGISVPVRSAICSRKALRSSLRSCSALRVSNSNAAGCRNGRISARPSSPITSAAPSSARSVSAARAVVTRSWARSVFNAPADAATCAAPKSVSAGDPSSRTTTVVASRCPCEMPSSCRSARTRHAPLTRSTSISLASSEPSVRALASSTRTASPCVGLAGLEHRQHGHTAPLGRQRHERFVLDLLEPSHTDPLRAPMPDRVPGGRDELAVLGIATEHLDHERPSLRTSTRG